MQNNMNVGIYLRLSRDDKNYGSESISIGNQREVLIRAVQEKGWNLTDEYADDGYTGTNFDRPDFKRLTKDIESKKINCVITTDCSRLGRNSSLTGYYIGTYFAENSVRYFSVYDNIDTEKGYNQMLSLYLAIHEMYPGQISVKVRDVKKSKAKKGEFIGSNAPYGYLKSEHIKNKLVADAIASKIVNRIFTDYANGKSGRAIADSLNLDKTPTPSTYFAENVAHKEPKKRNSWNSGTIMAILKRRAYIGDMVQGTRENVSFLVKKRRQISADNWIVVEGTHEPIIDKVLFELVHERMSKKPKHRTQGIQGANGTIKKRESILNEVAYCAECGYPLTASHIGKRGIFTYRCRNYVQGGKSACSSHSIKADDIEKYILSDIQQHAKLSCIDKKSLVNQVLEQLSKEKSDTEKMLVPRIAKLEKAIEETNFTISQLFKEKISGKLSEKIFYNLLNDYEKSLTNNEKELIETKNTLHKDKQRQSNVSLWIEEIQNYLEVKQIDRAMVMNLVERVEVTDRKTDNDADLGVRIHYKFASAFLGTKSA